MDLNQTFIRLGNELILFGNNEDTDMHLYDPNIHSVIQTLSVIKIKHFRDIFFNKKNVCKYHKN
jgi:hypothetical protein